MERERQRRGGGGEKMKHRETETGNERGMERSGQRKIKVGIEKNKEVRYQVINKDMHQKVTCVY